MDKKRLLELAGVQLHEMTDVAHERLVEVLTLAHDTLSRRDEVTEQTIEFTLDSIEKVLNMLDPSNLG